MPDRLSIDGDGRPSLVGRSCADCGTVSHGAVEGCPRCTSRRLEPVALARDGEVFSFTYVRRASRDWAGPEPYALAEVQLRGGPIVVARVLDWPGGPELAVGQRVRVAADPTGREDGDEEPAVYGWRREEPADA